MKNKNTIITILVLAVLWFVGQQFFFNKTKEAPVVNNETSTMERAESTQDSLADDSIVFESDEVEVLPENADVETLSSELEDLNNDEQALDDELDALDNYSF